MEKIKSQVFSLPVLFFLAIIAPLSGNQLITGTIVNALLFTTVLRFGLPSALLLSSIPSSVALLTGIFPFTNLLFLPLIIGANCVMVTLFSLLPKKPLFMILAALTKGFILIFLPFGVLIQFITALLGGSIALFFKD